MGVDVGKAATCIAFPVAAWSDCCDTTVSKIPMVIGHPLQTLFLARRMCKMVPLLRSPTFSWQVPSSGVSSSHFHRLSSRFQHFRFVTRFYRQRYANVRKIMPSSATELAMASAARGAVEASGKSMAKNRDARRYCFFSRWQAMPQTKRHLTSMFTAFKGNDRIPMINEPTGQCSGLLAYRQNIIRGVELRGSASVCRTSACT